MREKKKNEQSATLTEEITAVLEEVKDTEQSAPKKGEEVKILDDHQFLIGECQYVLVKNHREAFDPQRLGERFSEVLARYDYIVGDWGYDQLRLKGFFSADNRKANPEQRIDTLEDYLYEYCNFGCAYFVIERIGNKQEKSSFKKKRNKKNYNKQIAHVAEKKEPFTEKTQVKLKQRKTQENRKKQVQTTKVETEKERTFTIRQREE